MTFKWVFFDVGSTLVDETEAYDHRVREMIAGTNISFKEFDDTRIALGSEKYGLPEKEPRVATNFIG